VISMEMGKKANTYQSGVIHGLEDGGYEVIRCTAAG